MRVASMRKALITGITGQDGSYLAELLLSKGYEVHGLIRRASTFNTERINSIYVDPHKKGARFFLHYGDLSDSEQISGIIYNIKPDEVYHLGAQSHVRVSFDTPEYTGNVTALGVARILEVIRRSKLPIKFYQASSSEMFGSAKPPQNEKTAFAPRSPYACAKAYSYWMAKNYRDGYGLYASNGILFNHESPRRGETFVTHKVTRAVVNMLTGKGDCLYLGNMEARRDWGFSPEYVEAMWRILQQDKADDFVIGTGYSYSVRQLVEKAFGYTGVKLAWEGKGISEQGIVDVVKATASVQSGLKKGDVVVRIDRRYFRPTEVGRLVADIAKAKKAFHWSPVVTFDDLVKIMVDADMRAAGLRPVGEGDKIIRKKFPKKWWIGD